MPPSRINGVDQRQHFGQRASPHPCKVTDERRARVGERPGNVIFAPVVPAQHLPGAVLEDDNPIGNSRQTVEPRGRTAPCPFPQQDESLCIVEPTELGKRPGAAPVADLEGKARTGHCDTEGRLQRAVLEEDGPPSSHTRSGGQVRRFVAHELAEKLGILLREAVVINQE